jgi:hypothetical protein
MSHSYRQLATFSIAQVAIQIIQVIDHHKNRTTTCYGAFFKVTKQKKV